MSQYPAELILAWLVAATLIITIAAQPWAIQLESGQLVDTAAPSAGMGSQSLSSRRRAANWRIDDMDTNAADRKEVESGATDSGLVAPLSSPTTP